MSESIGKEAGGQVMEDKPVRKYLEFNILEWAGNILEVLFILDGVSFLIWIFFSKLQQEFGWEP